MSFAQTLAEFHESSVAGDRRRAAAVAEALLETWPHEHAALALVGGVLYELGEVSRALALIDRACAAPDAPAAHHARRASLYARTGDDATAVIAARRATELAPAQAGLHLELGRLLTGQGQYDEAILAYKRGVELDPNIAAGHLGLALVLSTLGRDVEAFVHAERAVELDGGTPGALALCAMIEGSIHGRDRAAARLSAVAEQHPNDATVNIALARTLIQLEQPSRALVAAQRAAAVMPHEPVVIEMLGICLQDLGRHAEALDVLQRAEGTSRGANILAKRGTILAELGRTAEASEVFTQALVADRECAVAWYGRADLRETKPSLDDLATMEAILATSPRLRAYDDRMILYFAAARMALACGETDRAFAHFAAGNQMKRATLQFDVSLDERGMREIAQFATREFFRTAGPGAASDVPIFVVGMPRSGTTLIERILAAHADVHGAGELSYATEVIASLPAHPQASDLTAAGQAYVDRLRPHAPEARHIVDKLPSNFFRAGLLHAMLPNAKIVHVRRDPLDTCFSAYTILFAGRQDFSYDLQELGRYYNAYRELMAYWREVLPRDRFFEIEYEAVVADVETEARRLIDWCGLPWDPACLRYYEVDSPVRTASKTQVRVPVYRSSIGRALRYRAYLEPLIAALGA